MAIRSVIPKDVKVGLAFNPATTTNQVIRDVFANRIARNLWLGIAWGHLVGETFPEDCLNIAHWIEQKQPEDPSALRLIFRAVGRDLIFTDQNADTKILAEELFPYVCGDLDFLYR